MKTISVRDLQKGIRKSMRISQRERGVNRTACFQQGDGLSQHPLGRHQPEALVLQSLSQLVRTSVVLIAPIAQGDPGSRVDEHGAERAHRRRFERRGAP